MDILLLIKLFIVVGLIISIYLLYKNIDVIKIILNYWKDKLLKDEDILAIWVLSEEETLLICVFIDSFSELISSLLFSFLIFFWILLILKIKYEPIKMVINKMIYKINDSISS